VSPCYGSTEGMLVQAAVASAALAPNGRTMSGANQTRTGGLPRVVRGYVGPTGRALLMASISPQRSVMSPVAIVALSLNASGRDEVA
jgi:hypothetical protein